MHIIFKIHDVRDPNSLPKFVFQAKRNNGCLTNKQNKAREARKHLIIQLAQIAENMQWSHKM